SNSKGSKVFFPSEFSKLAESFTNMAGNKPASGKASSNSSAYYKDLLHDYVSKAVKKASGKSAAPARKLKKKKK
ncbi:MAG: hypothetical protein WCI04_01890, partial [archaeon]